MDITVVGLGAWAMGGGEWRHGWGPQGDEESIGAIHAAVDGGVNWIDTAAIYGHGHSERIVGRAMERIEAALHPYVFTKCGLTPDPQNPYVEPTRDLRPQSIRTEVEASLERLGVERIDLYQFHWPDHSTAIEDSWGEMGRMIDEGEVRAIGISNHDLESLERAERIRHVDAIQPALSILQRDAAADLIPWAADHGSGVIVYGPMAHGLLTDSFSAERVEAMSEADWRRRNPLFQEPNLTRNLTLSEGLRSIASRHQTTVAALAVAWAASWPGVTGAIVGARNRAQAEGWLPAGRLTPTGSDIVAIADLLERTGAGTGPGHPDITVAQTRELSG